MERAFHLKVSTRRFVRKLMWFWMYYSSYLTSVKREKAVDVLLQEWFQSRDTRALHWKARKFSSVHI